MMFDDKMSQNGLSESENASRLEKSSLMEPFSFSALHFLRNRLMPTGRGEFSLRGNCAKANEV